ncbi:MAG: zinc ABC transporter substrate-binding protein [Deltaproteobacteria bacterium]|nr:zinc ABC transporter substrate-binding protein [Deltaproteobacteria bacterium]
MKSFIKRIIFYSLVGCLIYLTAWADEKVPVFVSIVPQRFFLEQIGKELVDIQVMVEPGASPHSYEPKPSQMAAVSKALVYFAIGVTFEKAWLKKISASNPRMLVVHTDHEIRKIPMDVRHHNSDQEDQNAVKHEREGLDPHIWLSPPLVMAQARNIMKGLTQADPMHQSIYEANYQAFLKMLAALDVELKDIFAGEQGTQFMVFHPAWGYFAEAYGLKQVPIEIEGKGPKPSRLKGLIDHARERNIKIVFVQPQFSSKSAEQVAKEIGGRVAFVDPLALNWAENLREVASKFKAAVK